MFVSRWILPSLGFSEYEERDYLEGGKGEGEA